MSVVDLAEGSEEAVSRAWASHWEASDMRSDDGSLRARLFLWLVAHGRVPSSMRAVNRIVARRLGDLRGKAVLDAGSGTGLNSLALARMGADVTLLDIAPRALDIAAAYFRAAGERARFVPGSIFAMPFPDASFDVVWNTGVLEHFDAAGRRKALAEMLRVMRPSGALLTINPCAGAPVYTFAKDRAERRGTWDVGFEQPIATLEGDIDEACYELVEERRGFFMQFHFLKYLTPRTLRLPYVAAHEVVQTCLPWLNRFSGYLLVSHVRARAEARAHGR